VLDGLRAGGSTLLVATHDIRQARDFDSVLCLNRHQVAFGPPAQALRPAALQETYGAELVVLDGGREAIQVQHHEH
jgi:ABC-type Mn2+/Zn2+ transport system ATPase subunit